MVHYLGCGALPKVTACANVFVKLKKKKKEEEGWEGHSETLKRKSLPSLWSRSRFSKVLYAVLFRTHSSEIADMVQHAPALG